MNAFGAPISDGCMIYSISSPCSCEEVGYASIVDGSLGANLKFKCEIL